MSPRPVFLLSVLCLSFLAPPQSAAMNHSGEIGTETWFAADNPHIITGNVTVLSNNVLTIQSGCVVRFAGNYMINVFGTIIANGTPSQHITFTSNQSSPSPGDWLYVSILGSGTPSSLSYCDFQYGGSLTGTVLFGVGPSASMTNCTIQYSGSAGIHVGSYGIPTISSCTIRNCAGIGVYCASSSGYPSVSSCVILDNGGYAVRTHASNVRAFTGTFTISGNNPDAFLVDAVSGGSTSTGTWLNHGVPYVINGNLTVSDGHTLTLSPGVSLRFSGPSYGLYVYGTLLAQGTSAQRITFTSNQSYPTPGSWGAFWFSGADLLCTLSYCDITCASMVRFASSTCAASHCTVSRGLGSGIQVKAGAQVTLSSCVFEDNGGAGVEVDGAQSQTRMAGCLLQRNQYGLRLQLGDVLFEVGNRVIDNTGYGVFLTGGASLVFGDTLTEWNDIYGNGTYDFYNGTANIHAHYVYWGTTDPELISSRIWDAMDNPSLGYVYFTQWLDASHEHAYTLSAPVIGSVAATEGQVVITWNPVPGACSYLVLSSPWAWGVYGPDTTGVFSGASWAAPLCGQARFFRVVAAAAEDLSPPSAAVGYHQFAWTTP